MTQKAPIHARLPYNPRALNKAVNGLQPGPMGSKCSAIGSHPLPGGDDDGEPPQKRRRLSSPSLAAAASVVSKLDNLIVAHESSDSRPTVRIDVFKLFHQDTKKVKFYQVHPSVDDDDSIKASCRLTISDLSSGKPRILHCQSQICEVITSDNHYGPHRVSRVRLDTPFFIPEDSIRIIRPDSGLFDFSDAYSLTIELQATGDGRWPPLYVPDSQMSSLTSGKPSSRRQLLMCAHFEKLYGRLKNRVTLSSATAPHRDPCPTEYLMDIDVRRTSGYHVLKRLEPSLKPSITAVDPDAPAYATEHFEPVLNGLWPGSNEPMDVDEVEEYMVEAAAMNGANGVKSIEPDLMPETIPESIPEPAVEPAPEPTSEKAPESVAEEVPKPHVNGGEGSDAPIVNGIHDANDKDEAKLTNGINGVSDSKELNGISDTEKINGVNGDDSNASHVNETNGINGINGHLTDVADHEDELEGDQTPSRSLRTREKNKVYNLKVLSDQAGGRERKRRARGVIAPELEGIPETEGKVTYLLPTNQPLCLDLFRCVTCGAHHQSEKQLQLHLDTTHTSYEYTMETTSNGLQFTVSWRSDPSSPSRNLHPAPPRQPFNLHSLAVGDHSWVTSRLSSDNPDDAPYSPRAKTLLEQFKSASPAPRTSKPPHSSRRTAPKDVTVPRNTQPLFHPISKAQLIPGEKVPEVSVDNTWLIQKHRDSIDEFSDVTALEKEFVKEWDGYILQQNLTTPAYFPRAWLGFVREKASWLVASQNRMNEFAKHFSVLCVRDVLDDKVIDDAFVFINAAREELQLSGDAKPDAGPPQSQSPRASHIRKSKSGCGVCQLPVMGPRMLLCSNKKCAHRVHHSDCVKDEAKTPVDAPDWLCNDCTPTKQSS